MPDWFEISIEHQPDSIVFRVGLTPRRRRELEAYARELAEAIVASADAGASAAVRSGLAGDILAAYEIALRSAVDRVRMGSLST